MLTSLFSRKRSRKICSAPDGRRAYAIGDVHGRLDLLEGLLDTISQDNVRRGPAKTYLVFLGDMVDRGPDSSGVIERLANNPPEQFNNIFLKGNHEEFFCRVLDGDESVIPHWLTYGGTECAGSYGLSPTWILNATAQAITNRLISDVPSSHKRFLAELADSFKLGDYLFVHAGIRPGIELSKQVARDLRWIRDGFLEDRSDHGVMVVHGHTIVDRAEEHPNRIAVDTGAYRSGVLTALGVEGCERWFLEARDF